jgi:CheY-like chemotaxis protein
MLSHNIEIMLVEDDEVDILNIQRAFKKHNVTNPLHIARNGIEALELLRQHDHNTAKNIPQIILLDINMPKMNGLEFLQELRSDPALKSATVFVLTTSDDEEDKFRAYSLNVAGYILKPLHFDDFLESMSQLNLFWSLIELPNNE